VLQTPLETDKEILGYKLLERIGSGGFGEVWSAIAPGGLKKAVKVVFGFHDGRRAQAELKALDRVKELRHPFLLSLERIDVHQGQLIVVSELADQSLADRFNQCIQAGEPGIARDEMLRYMRNASEALDYLSNEHGLQHLDIKPENLLVVGSHVKVADFGLIKDLHKASQSLMSGMTPAYAAPELFDGQPGPTSDQYSLAIVYQEMITGVRPFPGTTPAQLAAQHIHGKPNLRSLPKSDQPIIAKALSKDPAVRFATCCDLVDELGNQRRSVKKAIRRHNHTRDHGDTESRTLNLPGSTHGHDVTALISDQSMPFRATEIKILDPPQCDAATATVQPTLIIGVGSTGNRIVQKVKERLVSRYNSMDVIPAVKLLAIDTDRNALGALRREKGNGSLNNFESLETCLRKPEGYRGETKRKTLLSWLSRRWVYNIPRSLQTEGLRPLGRLAFADHFETICDRIQELIREMATPESVAQTADSLNMDPGAMQPRIFVVSSVAGGLGSGMVLDLAYTARLLANETGLKPKSVVGLMLHSSYQRYRDPGLAAANSFAFLTEMRHFAENGYPGDPNIGMPPFEEQPPFDYTYFNDLGNDLCQSEFDGKLDRIAEYLLLSSTSRCAEFFDQCREKEEQLEHFALRTFGLSLTGPGNLEAGLRATQRVARGLTRRWLTGGAEEPTKASELVQQMLKSADANSTAIAEQINDLIETHFPESFDAIVEQAQQLVRQPGASPQSQLDDFGDTAFGCPIDRRDSSYVEPEHCLEIESAIGMAGQSVGDQLAGGVLKLMEGSCMNLHLAQAVAELTLNNIKDVLDQIDEQGNATQQAERQLLAMLAQLPVQKASPNKPVQEKLGEIVSSYLDKRKNEFVSRYQRVFLRVVSNSVNSVLEMLQRFHNQIEMISNEFVPVDALDEILEEDNRLDMDAILNESVECGLSDYVLATERLVYENLIESRGGYVASLNEPAVWQGQLSFEIRNQAQRVLSEAYKKISLEKIIAQHNIEPERLVKWLNEKMLDARPEVNDCGGGSRLLVGMPELTEDDSLEKLLQKQFDVQGCPIRGTQGSFVMCLKPKTSAWPMSHIACCKPGRMPSNW
jgi:serine/threonine protein kinase